MKKKLLIGILSTALLAGGATAAFGATDQSKLNDLKSLYAQMFDTQKQIVDKKAEAGAITQEQANTLKSAIDLRSQSNSQALDKGQVPFGPGFGGRMGGGFAPGAGGCPGFNNGQPLTAEQQKAWNDAIQQRLQARDEALKNGTWAPGQGMGMRGGRSAGSVQGTTY